MMTGRTYIITIQHPAHVHFFKHTIETLTDAGHDIHVYAREKDVALELLEQYDLPHTVLAGTADSSGELAVVQATYEYRLFREARRIEPDVITAIGGMAAAHVAKLVGARSVIFTDTESVANHLAVPFADVVCTPRHFGTDFGAKQLRYDGYHELAYLHPDRFEPDPERLRANGIDPDGQLLVCRFSDMHAHHDTGEVGLSPAAKRKLVSLLADSGSLFVSTEGTTDRMRWVPPRLLLQLLYHADLLVTDSSTMATEAGLLGTPTIRSNSFADETRLRNFVELDKAGIVRSTPDEREALSLVREILEDPSSKSAWRRRRDRFVAKAVDVTALVVTVLTAVADPSARSTDVIHTERVHSAATGPSIAETNGRGRSHA